jgi:hypothetical protein
VHVLRMPAIVARRSKSRGVEPVMDAWHGEVVALRVTPVYKKGNRVKKSCQVFAAQNTPSPL